MAFITMLFGKGCAYPASYRALIPKQLDSNYREYKRLCEAYQKGIIYSRPVPQHIQDYYTTMQKTGLHNGPIEASIKEYWIPYWDTLWADDKDMDNSMRLTNVLFAESGQITLVGGSDYNSIPNEVDEKLKTLGITIPRRHYIVLKPYIFHLSFGVEIGHTFAVVNSLVDSQTGEIYVYEIGAVVYYTGWRENPFLTWGETVERTIDCLSDNKRFFSNEKIFYIYTKDPIASLHTLQSKGSKQDIEFLGQINTYYFTLLKQAGLKKLILQDEREKVKW